MRKFKGFTLLEVIITISIIGILLSIVSPNYTKSVCYVKQQEATNLGKQICLCIINSEITYGEITNQENIKINLANEINNFTDADVSKNSISIDDNQEIHVKYKKNDNYYECEVNVSNCKYKIYLINSEQQKLLLYDDYER